MYCRTLRPVPARLPGQYGSASRCGALTVLLILLGAFPVASPLAAASLEQRYQPEPLIAPPAQLVFLDARPEGCSHEGGCVLDLPHNPFPAVLAAPMRAHLPVAAARMLVPEPSRWLLAAGRGDLTRSAGLVLAAPQVGRPARAVSAPFDLVTRTDRLHITAMFLIGLMLMLAGSALGLIVQSPAAPAIPEAEPWIPEAKVLPRLVAAPVSPAHIGSQPL